MLSPLSTPTVVERLTGTSRLVLRPPEAADARAFRELLSDPANRRFEPGGREASERLEYWRMLWTRDGLGRGRWACGSSPRWGRSVSAV
ncbi:hypothetical protein Ddc_19749 [Ditylenchus destructor]|nr:hypothetical protein Ddc_19749 [Ditylenchus destructor]